MADPDTVDLGFFNGDFPLWGCEREYEEFETECRYFPSKVGGKPAWLNLSQLPTPDKLKCKICGAPSKFLLQIYSPDDKTSVAFHRTIFVFICVNKSCWSTGSQQGCPIVVLRSQLGRSNPFYPPEPPVEVAGWRADIQPTKYGALCPVCGCRGNKSCGRCRNVDYCSQEHQKLDWKKGHKQECKEGVKYGGPHAVDVFKEGLIEIEEEPDKDDEPEVKEGVDMSSVMEKNIVCEETMEVAEEDWDEVENNQTVDKASEKFNKRIRRAPHQIIRHDRGGEPLLCTFTKKLDPPANCTCGGERIFEFQVMPQMLTLLGLGTDLDGGVDWGSIYIYTCARSCEIQGYEEEIAFVSHFDNTNLPLQ